MRTRGERRDLNNRHLVRRYRKILLSQPWLSRSEALRLAIRQFRYGYWIWDRNHEEGV